MTKLHVNQNNEVKPCHANIKDCQFGDDSHFDNKKDAIKESEHRFEQETGGIFNNSLNKLPNKIKLSSNLGEVEVINGDLSNNQARLLLSSGLCGDLALNIHEKTGNPIVFVMYEDLSQAELKQQFEKDKNTVFRAQHVMVKSQNENKYLDSYGVKDFDEIDELYEGIYIVEGTPEMAQTFASDDYKDYSKFADTAIEFDKNNVSYEYDNMDEYSDDYDDEEYEDYEDDEDDEDN